jgi:DNA-binding XRE family transcriptional regulator
MYEKMKSRVARLREISGLTQVELAAFVGVTPNTIQNWEKDDGLAQLERYLRLAAILGCQVPDLIESVTVEGDVAATRSFSIRDLRELRKKWNLSSSVEDVPSAKPEFCTEES